MRVRGFGGRGIGMRLGAPLEVELWFAFDVDGVPGVLGCVDDVCGFGVLLAGVADAGNDPVELLAEGRLELGESILLGGGVDASSISISSSLV